MLPTRKILDHTDSLDTPFPELVGEGVDLLRLGLVDVADDQGGIECP